MKKLRFFSLFLLICLLLTGCASVSDVDTDTEVTEETEPENIWYSVLIYDHTSAFANVEYEFKDTESYSSEPESTKEFTVLGKTYEGEYSNMTYRRQNYYPMYFYVVSEEGIQVTFDHRGYISSIYFSNIDNTDGQKISRDEAMTKALDFVREIMIKEEKFTVDDYDISVSFDSLYNTYYVTLNKSIGEYLTADYAIVGVQDNGNIISFESNCFGMVNKDTEISFDIEHVTRCVDEKLDSIFKNEEKKLGIYDVEYEHPLKANSLIRLKNGTLALEYMVLVEYKDENSELNASISEKIYFIIQ